MKSERTYRFWEYCVSHDQMFLRSPKGEEHSTNHDIVFVGVSYCDVETMLKGLELRNATNTEMGNIISRVGKTISSENVFIIESSNRVNIVVAAAMKVLENEMDIFDSPLEKFSGFQGDEGLERPMAL